MYNEAKKQLGINGIRESCKETNSLRGGFQWKYKYSDKKVNTYTNLQKEREKPVLQLNYDGKIIKEFENTRQAAKAINKPMRQLRKRLLGYKRSYIGYIWKYK